MENIEALYGQILLSSEQMTDMQNLLQSDLNEEFLRLSHLYNKAVEKVLLSSDFDVISDYTQITYDLFDQSLDFDDLNFDLGRLFGMNNFFSMWHPNGKMNPPIILDDETIMGMISHRNEFPVGPSGTIFLHPETKMLTLEVTKGDNSVHEVRKTRTWIKFDDYLTKTNWEKGFGGFVAIKDGSSKYILKTVRLGKISSFRYFINVYKASAEMNRIFQLS